MFSRPRRATRFQRALETDSGGFARERAVVRGLASVGRPEPDAAFVAGLRAALLEAAADTPVRRPTRRRWVGVSISAAGLVAGAGAAYAFVLPGTSHVVTTDHPAAHATPFAGGARLTLSQLTRTTGSSDVTTLLATLRSQLTAESHDLLTRLNRGDDPAALAELQDLVTTSQPPLAALGDRVPSGATPDLRATRTLLADLGRRVGTPTPAAVPSVTAPTAAPSPAPPVPSTAPKAPASLP